jgi:hypothetical protein
VHTRHRGCNIPEPWKLAGVSEIRCGEKERKKDGKEKKESGGNRRTPKRLWSAAVTAAFFLFS